MAKTIIEAANTPSIYNFDGDTAELRLYATLPFITSDGQLIGQGSPLLAQSWYLPITCQIQPTGILYTPSFEIDSTTDGQPRVAKYIAALFTEDGAYIGPFPSTNPAGFAIPPPSLMPSPTWGQLAIYNRLPTLLYPPPTFPTSAEMYAAIAAAISQQLLKASETVVGNTALTVDPTAPAFPIAVAANDPLWLALIAGGGLIGFYWVGNYASLAAAVAAIGSTRAMLVIDTIQPVTSTLGIPPTLTLFFTNSGGIQPANGVVVTIDGPILSPPTRIFYNALAGQGAIQFTDNIQMPIIYGIWWGPDAGALLAAETAADTITTDLPVGFYKGVVDCRGTSELLIPVNSTIDPVSNGSVGFNTALAAYLFGFDGTAKSAVFTDDPRLALVAAATPDNTPNALVLRDNDGSFASGPVSVAGQVDASAGYQVDGIQVVGPQQPSIENATASTASNTAQINLILGMLRTWGAIEQPAPPDAPSALLLTVVSQTAIDLDWTDNSGGTASFKVERCTGGGCTVFSQIGTTLAGDTDFSDTGLSAGTSYSYRVRASAAGGDSGYSNVATATTQSAPLAPDAVSGLLFWLKASTIALSDGDPVSLWEDQSSNANDATQAGALRPTYQTNEVNGEPAVQFNGTTQWMSLTSPLATVRSLFIVWKHATGVQADAPLLGDATTFPWHGGDNRLVLSPTNASANVLSGSAYVNGQLDTPQNMLKPTSYRLQEYLGIGGTNVDYLTNDRNVAGRVINGSYAELWAYSGVPTPTERGGLEQYAINEYAAACSTTSVLRSNAVFVGDSQTTGNYTVRVINCLTGNCASPTPITDDDWFSTTLATSGFTLQDMASFNPSVAAARNSGRVKQAVVIWGGTNDFYFGASLATFQSRLQALITAYQSAGYGVAGAPIVFVPILPRSNSGTPGNYESNRTAGNSWAVTNAVSLGIVIADIAANTDIGQAGNETNPTYYSDLVHLTDAGLDIVAPIVQTAIDAAP